MKRTQWHFALNDIYSLIPRNSSLQLDFEMWNKRLSTSNPSDISPPGAARPRCTDRAREGRKKPRAQTHVKLWLSLESITLISVFFFSCIKMKWRWFACETHFTHHTAYWCSTGYGMLEGWIDSSRILEKGFTRTIVDFHYITYIVQSLVSTCKMMEVLLWPLKQSTSFTKVFFPPCEDTPPVMDPNSIIGIILFQSILNKNYNSYRIYPLSAEREVICLPPKFHHMWPNVWFSVDSREKPLNDVIGARWQRSYTGYSGFISGWWRRWRGVVHLCLQSMFLPNYNISRNLTVPRNTKA